MRLGQIREGDIVLAGGMHAIVVGRQHRRLVVRGICDKSVHQVRADELIAHWRKAKVRVPESVR
jgi:hypothetical protein